MFTRTLLMRWQAGERWSLWAELPKPSKRKRMNDNSLEKRQEQCERLVSLGRPGPAVQRLTSPGLANDTPQVRQKLLAKFPFFDHASAPRRLYPPPPGQIPVDGVVRGIKSFAHGAGPGPSGLRADFLRQCISKSDSSAQLYREFVQLFADGAAPKYLGRWYGGGGLMGVGKTGKSLDEDARPIVGGETWRKLTFKCTLAIDKQEVTDHLKPRQLAVGIKAGVDVMIHSSRKWFLDHMDDRDAVFLERDVVNAFNTADPSEFLPASAEHMPASARFAEWCYGGLTHMVYRGRLERSHRGQQGCPAMGATFCLMRRKMDSEVVALSEDNPEYKPEFADDSYLGGTASSVLAFFRAEMQCGKKYGLTYDLGECTLHLPAGRAFSGDVSEFEALGIKINWSQNLCMLKSPLVGDSEFCKEFL